MVPHTIHNGMPPTTDTPTSESLLDRTLRLLDGWDDSISQLARETKLNYFWLRKMRLRTVKNPGVANVEALYKFLSDAR